MQGRRRKRKVYVCTYQCLYNLHGSLRKRGSSIYMELKCKKVGNTISLISCSHTGAICDDFLQTIWLKKGNTFQQFGWKTLEYSGAHLTSTAATKPWPRIPCKVLAGVPNKRIAPTFSLFQVGKASVIKVSTPDHIGFKLGPSRNFLASAALRLFSNPGRKGLTRKHAVLPQVSGRQSCKLSTEDQLAISQNAGIVLAAALLQYNFAWGPAHIWMPRNILREKHWIFQPAPKESWQPGDWPVQQSWWLTAGKHSCRPWCCSPFKKQGANPIKHFLYTCMNWQKLPCSAAMELCPGLQLPIFPILCHLRIFGRISKICGDQLQNRPPKLPQPQKNLIQEFSKTFLLLKISLLARTPVRNAKKGSWC